MFNMLSNFLRVVFTSGIIDGKEEIESGGPQCENYMSYQYRLLVSTIMIPIYIVVYKKISKNVREDIMKDHIKETDPSYVELFFGYFSIFVFFLHCFYKALSGQLMFIFNPCHLVNLVEAYLLINKNDVFKKQIYIAVMNLMFSPWTAILFPVTIGLNAFLEIEMFWIEHYLAALINPLILSFSSRYYTDNTISIKNHIMAHCLFGLYQRVVLLPLGALTTVNLNYILCPSNVDPFVPKLGKYYYFASDCYLFLGGEIFHRLVKVVLTVLKKITSKLEIKELNDDKKSQ